MKTGRAAGKLRTGAVSATGCQTRAGRRVAAVDAMMNHHVAEGVTVAPRSMREFVVLDTETTGLGRTARLVELAALYVRDGVVHRELVTLVDPEVPIPWQVTQVHGITNEHVRGAPRAAEVLRELAGFLGGLPVVAHNARFDRGILAGEFARVGARSPGVEMYCSLRLAKGVLPEAPNHRLGTLVRELSLGDTAEHRARGDALAALGVWRACVAMARGRWREIHGAAERL